MLMNRKSYVPLTSAKADDIDNLRGCKRQRHDTTTSKALKLHRHCANDILSMAASYTRSLE